MLKKIAKAQGTAKGNYAIVAAMYNTEYTDSLVESAVRELKSASKVEILRVPGSFEIPAVASRLTTATNPKFDAIICFGVIFQGKTSHANHIAEAVSNSLAMLQVHARLPIIHGVLHFETEEQARVRCFGTEHNRGIEAARTAMKMVELWRELDAKSYFASPKKPRG